ncbi:MAG: hypothetical protein WCX97_01980 [Candidatus Magasanikbacteria bacterium]
MENVDREGEMKQFTDALFSYEKYYSELLKKYPQKGNNPLDLEKLPTNEAVILDQYNKRVIELKRQLGISFSDMDKMRHEVQAKILSEY